MKTLLTFIFCLSIYSSSFTKEVKINWYSTKLNKIAVSYIVKNDNVKKIQNYDFPNNFIYLPFRIIQYYPLEKECIADSGHGTLRNSYFKCEKTYDFLTIYEADKITNKLLYKRQTFYYATILENDIVYINYQLDFAIYVENKYEWKKAELWDYYLPRMVRKEVHFKKKYETIIYVLEFVYDNNSMIKYINFLEYNMNESEGKILDKFVVDVE